MGFDDGKYFQNCKLICIAPDGCNGKTVSVTDGSKSYTGTVANNMVVFDLPGRSQYTVQLMNAASMSYQTTVELGYGECVALHLETGYEEVIKRELMSLEAITASTGDLTKVAPQAAAVATLNSRIQDKAGFIDVNKKTTIFNEGSFGTSTVKLTHTFNKDGWISLRLSCANGNLVVYIDDVSLGGASYWTNSANYYGRMPMAFPVKAGQTLRIDRSGSTQVEGWFFEF